MSSRRLIQVTSAFMLGVCAGAWLVVPFFASRLREMAVEAEALQQELIQVKARAESTARAVPEEPTVKEVDCLVYCDDPAARLELTRQLSDITSQLVGRPLRLLDPFLLHSLLHGRRLSAQGTDYLIRVEAVLAAERIAYYLRAVPAPASP